MNEKTIEIEPAISPADSLVKVENYPGNGAYPPPSHFRAGNFDYNYYPHEYGDNAAAEEEDRTIHIREVFRKIRKHKWLILSIVTVVTTLVAIQAYRIKPWYTASSVIEIGKENTLVLKAGDMTLNDDSDPQYLVNVNTKMLTLESPEFYEKVVRELNLDKRTELLMPKEKKTFFGKLFGNSEGRGEGVSPVEIVSTGNTQADESRRLAPFVKYIQGKVSTELIKNTRGLKISYTDEDPKLSSEVTNAIATVFMRENFDKQTEKFTSSADWLSTTTRDLKSKVERAEEDLAAYTRANGIYSTEMGSGSGEKSATLTTAKLTQLHDQYIKAQTEKTLKQSLYEQVLAGRVAALPEAFSDSLITNAQSKLANLEEQESELKVKFGPNHPKIQEVRNQIVTVSAQIENSRKALAAKLKTDYERALSEETALGAALERAKREAVSENQASIKYNILKQDVETARSLYTDFLQKTNQAKAQLAEQNNNMKIIQKAQVPEMPVGPKKTQFILIGFLLSLAGAIGVAFFIDYLDNTVKTVDDVERYAQLPAIGVIPVMNGKGVTNRFRRKKSRKKLKDRSESDSLLGLEVKTNDDQEKLLQAHDVHSLSGEAYRALRTSLLLSSAGTPPKTILVTSGQASEGKSTTALNTAISLAQLGSKVIIIDCDLRKPTIHRHVNISAALGVTTFLSSRHEVDPLIQNLQIPNLSVIPSGPIPPNPAELLGSKRMKELLKVLSERYDHIIIDSPPIFNVTDPIILSTLVDGTILVAHGGKSTRDALQRSRHELLSVRAKIFGVVLNNVDLKKEGYDYYYYRYSYYGKGKNAEL